MSKQKQGPAEEKNDPEKTPPIVIKKYANRRLYNTSTSSYVTLDHLSAMVKNGSEFIVKDAKSGEDITRQVLTHIIVEEESKGENLLPISFLRHLISFYGDNLQSVVPGYLEQSMQAFARNQEQMRDYMKGSLGGIGAFNPLEDIGKQNAELMKNAMKLFAPYYAAGGPAGNPKGPDDTSEEKDNNDKKPPETSDNNPLNDLKAQLEEMQKQINKLSGNS